MSVENSHKEKSCILLSSFNGEKYLEEQIESLLLQEDVDPKIIIRDDGSADKTCAIIRKYTETKPERVEKIESTGNVGPTRSFILLLQYAVKSGFDYFFFCDQDDVWKLDKCKRAIERLQGEEKPALYFSEKCIVDSNLKPLGIQDRIMFSDTVWDCFTYSNVSGCTMCLNRSLAEKLIRNDFVEKKYLHDAFLYRLSIVMDATIVYDNCETMLYRQHGNNVVGSIETRRLTDILDKKTVKKRKHYMRDMFRDILRLYPDSILEENKYIVQFVANYDGNWKRKLGLLWNIMNEDCPSTIKGKLAIKIILNIL